MSNLHINRVYGGELVLSTNTGDNNLFYTAQVTPGNISLCLTLAQAGGLVGVEFYLSLRISGNRIKTSAFGLGVYTMVTTFPR